MAFHIRHHEQPRAAIRRIAAVEVRSSIDGLRSRHPSTHEAVHEFRKSCKKVRGLIRLVRPDLEQQYTVENRFYRDLSRELSYVRDTQALVEAVDRLTQFYAHLEDPQKNLSDVRSYLIDHRDKSHGGEDQLHHRLDSIANRLESGLDRIDSWEIQNNGFDSYGVGLSRNYRQARKEFRSCRKRPTSANFHAWRKRVKYHWHHAVLLGRSGSRLLKPHIRMTEELGELLGQYQDYSVLRTRIVEAQESAAFNAQRQNLMRLLDLRQSALQKEAFDLGRFVLAETPKQLCSRWRRYWKAWQITDTDS